MKIRKRHSPADFQTLADGDVAPMIVAFKRDAATDTEIAPEAFMAEPRFDNLFEPQGASPLQPPPVGVEVAQASSRTPVRRPEAPSRAAASEPAGPSGWPIYLAALFVSVTWACAPIAFAFGYRQAKSPFDFDPFVIAVLGAMAVGPAAFVWIAAYMIQQARKLGAETRRAKAMTDEMVAPAIAAGIQAGELVEAMREEISRASQAAEEARDSLSSLRHVLAHESQRLLDAAGHSTRAAGSLAETLGREREEMADLGRTLEGQAGKVTEAIAQQARMVADASDLAETQLREAEASLAARAADLAAAAGEATDAARTAGEDLTRHIARLETAGVGVSDQIKTVERDLNEQRAGLVTLAAALRSDQDVLASQTESHNAQLAELISQARLSAAELGDRAVKGGEALRQLIVEAAEQFRELADAAKAERDEFGQSTLHSLEQVSEAAAQERNRLEAQTRAAIDALADAAERTRAAAERHAQAAREQVDQLSEAAFSAGQRANSVFESRLEEARQLIERSAQMVEEAGAATARKLDEGASSARATLRELSAMLAEIEAGAARLPSTARGQAEEVRQAVADSMEDLMDQARRTAAETQAIDAAFQERVRRNYEMLSEAVRLMGAAASGPAALGPLDTSSLLTTPPAPRARPARSRAAPPPVEAAPAPVEAPPVVDELELTEPAGDQTPRRRLRLTPTATDEEFSQVFEQASGRPPEPQAPREGDGAWTWKDLLTSIDDTDGKAVSDPGDDGLAAEIAAMGIDPAALLPKARIVEIADTLSAGDVDGARETVRRLAPAATRRLTRRLFSDEPLRRRANAFLVRYQDRVAEAVEGTDGDALEALLGSEPGRAYLLLETAAGDLA